MAEFKVQIKCMWNSETGGFENCAGEEESMQDNEEEEDDDDDDAEWNVCICFYARWWTFSRTETVILVTTAAHGVCVISFLLSLFHPKHMNFCPLLWFLALGWIVVLVNQHIWCILYSRKMFSFHLNVTI